MLFDGVCNLCSASVQFIIRHDPGERFHFAALQSRAGQEVLERYGPGDRPIPDSVMLYESGRLYSRSTAALRIARRLRGWPRWLAPLGWMVPTFLRDRIYDLVARHRYRWFGRRQQCWLPTPALRRRFVDDSLPDALLSDKS